MKKGGFTLLELLAVVTIVAVIGVSATLAFSNIENETATEELKNIYIEIQRSANLYLDLHNSDLESFIKLGKLDFKVEELKNQNYIDSKLENPVTHEEISGEYYVRLYIKYKDGKPDEVGSCILDRNHKDDSNNDVCIANEVGEPNNCCE